MKKSARIAQLVAEVADLSRRLEAVEAVQDRQALPPGFQHAPPWLEYKGLGEGAVMHPAQMVETQ